MFFEVELMPQQRSQQAGAAGGAGAGGEATTVAEQ